MISASLAKVSALLACAFLLGSCVEGTCRPLKHPELAQAAINPSATTSGDPGKADMNAKSPLGDRVFVYKADGSLQCNMAKGIAPEEMEKELGGIQVFSRATRADGKMHIQVCGSPTGQVNVFEIPSSSLKDAEKRGFKKFEPTT
jgi:hypothetical protein